jgi:hypothetical protein
LFTPELRSNSWTVKRRSEIELSCALNISASTVNRIVLELQRERERETEKKTEGKCQHFSRRPREYKGAVHAFRWNSGLPFFR